LQSAPFGLREPGGPWLAPGALATVRTIFVPALAVDRHGVRLGRGAGFYDRSLSFRDPAARMIAVVRDDELVDELPAEPHDVPMTNALTPRRGLVVFP
jgi:5-formyltetrahydrofolate cyclo-ligase